MHMSRPRRRQRIVELLAEHEIASQQQLLDLLAEEGVATTQATLSRDLTDLGIVKTPSGYALPEAATAAPAGPALGPLLRRELLGIDRAGPLLVLRTRPGLAGAVALAIDRNHVPGVVGTVAGDDTIFVAVSGVARTVQTRLAALAGLEDA